MFGSTAKTSGFQTDRMTFSTLRKTLAWQKTNKGLSDDAKLRSTAKKGLYVKDGISRKGFSFCGFHFRGPLIERGNKYLKARNDIARSINLSYGNLMYEGQLLGNYVIDQLLTERAQQESAAASENGVADPEDVKRRKGNMSLRYRDLETLQAKIDEVKAKLDEKGTYVVGDEGQNKKLPSSIGYMRGRQSYEAVGAGTQALIQSLTSDFLAHERSTQEKAFFNNNQGLLRKRAKLDAIKTLKMMGMKVHKTDKGKELFYLPGGLTPQNVVRAENSLADKGIGSNSNTRALLSLAELPSKINAHGDALLELDRELYALASDCNANEARATLEFSLMQEHDYPPKEASKCREQLKKIEADTHKLVEENRDLVRELQSLSYPGDLLDDDNKRAELYRKSVANLKKMDQIVSELDIVYTQYKIAPTSAISKAASNMFDTAQDFCTETLALAANIYPETDYLEAVEPKPSDIRFPGLNNHWRRTHYDSIVEEGLSYKAKAPDILFQDDSTGENNLNRRIAEHNTRIRYLSLYKEQYFKLKLGAPEILRGRLNKTFYENYQENLNRAIRDNDMISENISRRQNILGIGANDEINIQLKAAKKQHNALMLLLHPNLAPSPHNDSTPVQHVELTLDESIDFDLSLNEALDLELTLDEDLNDESVEINNKNMTQ